MGDRLRLSPMPGTPGPAHDVGMETTTNAPQDGTATGTTSSTTSQRTWSSALIRPARGRMLAGVAAGTAGYLDVDPTLVRIAFAVLTAAGGAGIPLYLAGWLLIPEEGSQRSVAGDLV